jgi:hypothetical protein
MNALRFSGLIVGILAVTQPLLIAAARDRHTRAALLAGGLMAGLNAVAAYACARWAAPRSLRALLWAVLGGMTARMLLLLGLLALAITLVQLPAVPLVLSLMGYFATFLALEAMALPRLFRVATP